MPGGRVVSTQTARGQMPVEEPDTDQVIAEGVGLEALLTTL
jgi:hypothetical protein